MFVSCAKKEDADINKIVSDAYPNVSIESLKKIDENFHEIIINNGTIIQGKMFQENHQKLDSPLDHPYSWKQSNFIISILKSIHLDLSILFKPLSIHCYPKYSSLFSVLSLKSIKVPVLKSKGLF